MTEFKRFLRVLPHLLFAATIAALALHGFAESGDILTSAALLVYSLPALAFAGWARLAAKDPAWVLLGRASHWILVPLGILGGAAGIAAFFLAPPESEGEWIYTLLSPPILLGCLAAAWAGRSPAKRAAGDRRGPEAG